MSRPSRERWLRVLVLAWTLPLVLLGTALNGRTFLLHAHDDAGAHLHVLAEHHEHPPEDKGAHVASLAAEHAGHAHSHHGGQAPAPREHHEGECFAVSFCGPIQAGPPTRVVPAQRVILALVEPSPVGPPRGEARGAAGGSPRPVRVEHRSGAAALVAAGRALRI